MTIRNNSSNREVFGEAKMKQLAEMVVVSKAKMVMLEIKITIIKEENKILSSSNNSTYSSKKISQTIIMMVIIIQMAEVAANLNNSLRWFTKRRRVKYRDKMYLSNLKF